MKKHQKPFWIILISALVFILAAIIFYFSTYSYSVRAKRILERTGTSGGLIVHLGCKNEGKLTTALYESDRYLVHGLSRDTEKVKKARDHIREKNLYGKVSVEHLTGNHLPYTDNLVDCIVAEDSTGISGKEMMRVLSPGGTAYIMKGGQWEKKVKPVPQKIDEWTHHLHSANGNPVSKDKKIGPPSHYQWISDPLWLRSHETHSSISGIVTSNGRMFYFENEAPISLAGNNGLPNKWVVKARDAFNGKVLWKKELKDWGWREWKNTWFLPRPGKMPLNLHRRMVASENKVYVTLGYHSPVYQLDARNGEIIRKYPHTKNTYEILYHKGNLLLTVKRDDKLKMLSVDAGNGNIEWETKPRFRGTKAEFVRWRAMHGSIDPAPLNPVLNPATNGKIISLIDTNDLVGLDYQTGKELWRTSLKDGWQYKRGKNSDFQSQGINNLWAGTIIIKDDVVLHASPDKLAGFSAKTGKQLWVNSKKYIGWLWFEWKDVFVSRDLVWTWGSKFDHTNYRQEGNERSTHWPRYMKGYDLQTGEQVKKIRLDSIFTAPHHHRCYRNKATEQFVIASRRGAEFIDLTNGSLDVNNWLRGTCHYGMLPANGLLYAPPHPCTCYMHEKLKGFNALSHSLSVNHHQNDTNSSNKRVKGPAFGNASGYAAKPDDWPTYRHDPQRSGSTPISMTKKVKLRWNIDVEGKLSPPTIVDDKVFLSVIDRYKVLAYDAKNGKKLWEYTTGGRVDTPPTYYQGKVLFGSADGKVYCLRASDGELVWTFHAAPQQRYIMSFQRLESAWPVHGSIMIQNEVAYFAAGRSSHLDGGIFLYGVDPSTGNLLHYQHLQGPGWNTQKYTSNVNPPQGALTGIFQGDGSHVYMRHLKFDSSLNRKNSWEKVSFHNRKGGAKLRALGGFLDDTYFKRAYWYFGNQQNWGRLIVNDGNTFYGVKMFETLQGLNPEVFFTPGKKGYQIYRKALDNKNHQWTIHVPIRVKAMVAGESHLFIAGPPDKVDPEDPLAAFEGRKGGVFSIISCDSGSIIGSNKLEAPPVFNGMAAAGKKLFMSLQNGRLLCFDIK